MTFLEVTVALPIVAIALGMFLSMFVAGTGLRETSRDEWIASSAAQDMLESIRNEDFPEVFRLYNGDAFDDPSGPGTAPGTTFDVQALRGAGDTVGEVLLPAVNTGSEVAPVWELREDMDDALLGVPRDLNGDVVIDDQDHAADYTILPVAVRLRWEGPHGPREYTLTTIFSEFQ